MNGPINTPAPTRLGPVEFGAEDSNDSGSTFREVRDALFANPYYAVWGGAGEPALPEYQVTLRSLLAGILPFGRRYRFFAASTRTVDSRADLRWGTDGLGYRRLLHPNGVCLTGDWIITEPTDYSGFFRQESRGLVIGRYSIGGPTRRGRARSRALVAKLYPTTDPNSQDRSRPAGLITQQDFGGGVQDYFNDVELRNAPDTHAWRRGLLDLVILTVTSITFTVANRKPTIRQLYEIAELGKSDGEATRSPEFLRLLVDDAQPRIVGEGLDFRDEIMAQIYDRGNPEPNRELVFHIEVSDDGETHGTGIYQRRAIRNWKRIGRLTFREAVVSYNGDFVVHFHHPGWRTDRNDPSTDLRKNANRIG
jgi:hypothetical protein